MVRLVGVLGVDPELEVPLLEDGIVARLNIATQAWDEDKLMFVDVWHRVKVVGEAADDVLQQGKKGLVVDVYAQLSNRKWEFQGENVYVTEVVSDKVTFLTKEPTDKIPEFARDFNER